MKQIIPEQLIQTLHTDIAIVGGGTAGCLAAIAAADEGADVVVIERDNALGGVGTRGGIHQYHWGSPGGYQNVLDRECHRISKLLGAEAAGFSPDIKRMVLARSFKERNIKVLFQTIMFDAERVGERIKCIRVSTPDGICEVNALIYIDATGDADLTALVGGKFTGGRERDGLNHPLSLVPRVMNDRGAAVFLNVDGGWADSSDPADISRAWMDTRQWVRDCYKEDGHVLGISPQLGIREGRHIVGEYVVSMDDYIADRTYPDTIVRTFSHYDNHARDFGNENDLCQIWVVILGLLKAPLWGDIPYPTLLPRGISNLLVTGRAFSVHRDVFAGMRMQRDMQKLGEAAGVAAALAARDNTNPRNIDIKELQEAMVRRGVLKSGDLSRTGTPNLSFSSGPLAARELSGEVAAQLLPELATYLGNGGLEEGIALWWIAKTGEQGKSFLALFLNGEERYERRRAAAFGLALLGDRRATGMLLSVLRTRDPYCPPPDLKPIPRWVAALAALRLLKATEALDDVLTLLKEAQNPGFYTFMLRYLADLAPLFTQDQKERIVRDIQLWLQSDLPRGPFVLQNAKSPVTYEWNLEMNAAVALYACGSDIGLKYCTAYLEDPRAFVRQFAEKCYETMKGKAMI